MTALKKAHTRKVQLLEDQILQLRHDLKSQEGLRRIEKATSDLYRLTIDELQEQLKKENEAVIRLKQENDALTVITRELKAYCEAEMEKLRAYCEAEMEKLRAQPVSRRERLPDTRASINHKFEIGGVEGYIIVGMYPDGRPGELFVNIQKEGSTVGGLMDCIGVLTSVALQYGVPLEKLVRKFEHQRFEPSGITGNPNIRQASSIVDYVFRWMSATFPTAAK